MIRSGTATVTRQYHYLSDVFQFSPAESTLSSKGHGLVILEHVFLKTTFKKIIPEQNFKQIYFFTTLLWQIIASKRYLELK